MSHRSDMELYLEMASRRHPENTYAYDPFFVEVVQELLDTRDALREYFDAHQDPEDIFEYRLTAARDRLRELGIEVKPA